MSIAYPNIDPIAVSIGPLAIHWYGIMYLLGFGLAWLVARWRVKHLHLKWTADQIGDLIFFAAVGTVLGGRIGYMLFYGTSDLIHNPFSIVKVWQGGMSFHGGFLGVICAMYYFSRTRHKPFLAITDFIAPLVPLGLAAARSSDRLCKHKYSSKSSVRKITISYILSTDRHCTHKYSSKS